jgi:hypothetical protein
MRIASAAFSPPTASHHGASNAHAGIAVWWWPAPARASRSNGVAALAGYAGLDVGTVKAAVEAGKARAEVARQYRESTAPPNRAPGAAQEAAGAPTSPGPGPSKGVASPSLCEALRIQAQERDWEISAREAVSHLNEAAAAPSRTAVSTIEALLYELRSGLSCFCGPGRPQSATALR